MTQLAANKHACHRTDDKPQGKKQGHGGPMHHCSNNPPKTHQRHHY